MVDYKAVKVRHSLSFLVEATREQSVRRPRVAFVGCELNGEITGRGGKHEMNAMFAVRGASSTEGYNSSSHIATRGEPMRQGSC